MLQCTEPYKIMLVLQVLLEAKNYFKHFPQEKN